MQLNNVVDKHTKKILLRMRWCRKVKKFECASSKGRAESATLVVIGLAGLSKIEGASSPHDIFQFCFAFFVHQR